MMEHARAHTRSQHCNTYFGPKIVLGLCWVQLLVDLLLLLLLLQNCNGGRLLLDDDRRRGGSGGGIGGRLLLVQLVLLLLLATDQGGGGDRGGSMASGQLGGHLRFGELDANGAAVGGQQEASL